MPSCRVILKKLVRDKRITIDEYDKLLRNLKPQITKEDAIDYLHQIRWMQAHDKEIYKQGYECGKNERIHTVNILCDLCKSAIESDFDFCPYCGEKVR